MNENYLGSSCERLRSLWIQEARMKNDWQTSLLDQRSIIGRAPASTSRKDRLAATVIRHKARVKTLLAKQQLWLSPEEAVDELNTEDGIETEELSEPVRRHLDGAEVAAEDRAPYERINGIINSLRVRMAMNRIEIGDILTELGLHGITEEDLLPIRTAAINNETENYKRLVTATAEKISRKVAIITTRLNDTKYQPLQRVPDGDIARLGFPMTNIMEGPTQIAEVNLSIKVEAFIERVNQVARISLNRDINPQDKNRALRVFRSTVSTIFQPAQIDEGLSTFLAIFRTMELTPAGKKLLETYDLTQLFDMSNPVVMLGVAVHFSQTRLNHKKLHAVRRIMVAEESTMTREDWVTLFKAAEELAAKHGPESEHFVRVIIQQFINSAIKAAFQDGDALYFNKGFDLINEVAVESGSATIEELDQVFSNVPDRVQIIFDAVRDYDPELFLEFLRTFFRNGIKFRSVGRGSVGASMHSLWGRKTAKMGDLVDSLFERAGIYEEGRLTAFKERNYQGMEPMITRLLEAVAERDTTMETNLLPAAVSGVATTTPAPQPVPTAANEGDNPFDI